MRESKISQRYVHQLLFIFFTIYENRLRDDGMGEERKKIEEEKLRLQEEWKKIESEKETLRNLLMDRGMESNQDAHHQWVILFRQQQKALLEEKRKLEEERKELERAKIDWQHRKV